MTGAPPAMPRALARRAGLAGALLAAAALAAAPAGPLAGITLADRSGQEWRLDELAGAAVMVVVGDRATRDDAAAWGERLGRARPEVFAPWREPETITMLSVARLPEVPAFARSTVVAMMPAAEPAAGRASPLLLDWGGALAERLALADGAAAVVLLGPRHEVRARAAGAPDDAGVARLLAALDALRTPEAP